MTPDEYYEAAAQFASLSSRIESEVWALIEDFVADNLDPDEWDTAAPGGALNRAGFFIEGSRINGLLSASVDCATIAGQCLARTEVVR